MDGHNDLSTDRSPVPFSV